MNNPTSLDVLPFSTVLVCSIQNHTLDSPLLCLFDSGSMSTWIKRSAIPRGVVGRAVSSITSQTMAGNFSSNQAVTLEHITLPEFMKNHHFNSLEAHLLFQDCRYDIIFGRDALR